MKQQMQIQIAEPCHEDWNKMSATEQGRFCLSCRKEVVDFSSMTDKEILKHISDATKSICGRADNSQLSRVLAAPPEPRKIWWRYWMGLAASFVMMTAKSNAQTGPLTAMTTVAPVLMGDTTVEIVVGKISQTGLNEKAVVVIEGTISDENNNPIPFASVKLANSSVGVAADSAGKFVLRTNTTISKIQLEISSVGYESKLVKLAQKANVQSSVSEKNTTRLRMNSIRLKQAIMGEVIIAAPSQLSGRMGGLTAVCVRYSMYEKAKDMLIGNSAIKVYPNPIAVNNNFKLVFNLKEPGEYLVQFTDASGKLIASRPLNIVGKNQLESFNGNMFGASGLYVASISGMHTTKLYSTRLLVQ